MQHLSNKFNHTMNWVFGIGYFTFANFKLMSCKMRDELLQIQYSRPLQAPLPFTLYSNQSLKSLKPLLISAFVLLTRLNIGLVHYSKNTSLHPKHSLLQVFILVSCHPYILVMILMMMTKMIYVMRLLQLILL